MKKIFEKTIKGILTNRDLMKDIFSSIGYFVLVAGILKFAIESANQIARHVFIEIFLLGTLLGVFVFFFWAFYVARPIVKINWPEFKLHGMDSDVEPEMCRQMIKRPDFWAFMALAGLPMWLGWRLVSVILEKIT